MDSVSGNCRFCSPYLQNKSKEEGNISNFSSYIIPCIIALIIIYAYAKGVGVYDAFTEGARQGVGSVISMFPSVFALFIAVGALRGSGFIDFLGDLLSPLCSFLRLPTELIPFILIKPISGSASLALASDIFSNLGSDSYAGRLASVIMGSTETVFYTIAVYFGACKIQNIRYSLKCALLANIFGIILSIIVCSFWEFG